MSGSTQVNAYRALFLLTILVGDPKLGGISLTISAYESLLLCGYQVDVVTMFHDSYYCNYEYLVQYFTEQRVPFYSVTHPPNKFEDAEENYRVTEEYYSRLTNEAEDGNVMLFDD
jgi:bifunctional dethiobiotin synthetase / adenosylmethionine---8-amino-7-oxononanoate aminotransferase